MTQVLPSPAATATMEPDEAAEFLAMAVHELRNPATVVLGMAETLERLWGTDRLATDGPAVLEALVRNSRQMRRLMGDLLTSAFLEHGSLPLHVKSVPLRPILGWAVESTTALEGEATIECDPALHSDVDPDRLEQIVANLVSNALSHGAPPVQIQASQPARPGSGIWISVRDHGRGVDTASAARLFDRFSPLSARTSASTGLGLSIARRLARAMGGDVIYQRASPGSRFVVTLAGAAR